MLTCYGHTCHLPRGYLTYAAFRTAAVATLDELEWFEDGAESELYLGEGCGFLSQVPLLESIDPIIQLDLLGEVWARQHPREPVEATLLDAAVVYAACQETEDLLRDEARLVRLYLRDGPKSVRIKFNVDTAERFEGLFDSFWDDLDFLTLGEWLDLPGDRAEFLKRHMRMADDAPLFQALERGTVSEAFGQNLHGLLTTSEIEKALALGRRTGSVPARSAS